MPSLNLPANFLLLAQETKLNKERMMRLLLFFGIKTKARKSQKEEKEDETELKTNNKTEK